VGVYEQGYQGKPGILEKAVSAGFAREENGRYELTEQGKKWVDPEYIMANQSDKLGSEEHRRLMAKTIGKLHEIVTNSVPENGLLKLPKLGYSLTGAKREVLEKIAQSEEKSVAQIAKELKKTRGMIYQHLRELRDTGYVDEKFNVTEAGQLALL
jgi:DNA-binding transcriptional ArsR family regulator